MRQRMGSPWRLAALGLLLALLASGCSPAPESEAPVRRLHRSVLLQPIEPATDSPVSVAVPAPASTEEPAPSPAPPGSRRALLIGIDEAIGAGRLQGAVGDAHALQRALDAYGFPEEQVTLLTNEEASRDAILSSISRLAAETPRDGTAVFAFAGHTRKRSGANHIVAADGRTISADELAGALARVTASMWVALPTCYAAGFSLPGIVGPGRVATFASSANELAWEDTSLRRSFLIHYMVVEGMLSGRASRSVEDAFTFAHDALSRRHPNRVPLMEDHYAGELLLGPPIRAATSEADVVRNRPQTDSQPPPAEPTPQPSNPSGEPPEESNREKRRSGTKACGPGFSFGSCS